MTLLELLTKSKQHGISENFVLKVVDINRLTEQTFDDVVEMYEHASGSKIERQDVTSLDQKTIKEETIKEAISTFTNPNKFVNAGVGFDPSKGVASSITQEDVNKAIQNFAMSYVRT